MKKVRSSMRRGFSLLELSIVLGIISLIAGAGMNMASGALKAADRITTQERLNTIKLALDSFAKTYGYLPCPFDRTLTPTSATFGVEARTVGTSTCVAAAPGLINAENIWFGGVPVRTLGLPDSYAADAWGNKLTYAVSDRLKRDPTSYSTEASTIILRYGDRSLPDADTYNITSQRMTATYTNANSAGNASIAFSSSINSGTIVMLKPTAAAGYSGSYFAKTSVAALAPTLLTHDAALASNLAYSLSDTGGTAEWQEPGVNVSYVVVSHGPDGRGAYPFNGTAIPGTKLCNTSATANTSPPPCTSSGTVTCIDIENCNEASVTAGYPATFFDTAYNDGTQASQYFDDYVVWGSNSVFRAPVNASLYTGATSNCPTSSCETWCAACAVNYPSGLTLGGTSTFPLSTATPVGPITASTAVLFKKVITSDSSTCQASCFWGGVSTMAPIGYIKAP